MSNVVEMRKQAEPALAKAGEIVALHLALPNGCDEAVKTNVEKAAMRLAELNDHFDAHGDMVSLARIQSAIADAVLRICTPALDALLCPACPRESGGEGREG